MIHHFLPKKRRPFHQEQQQTLSSGSCSYNSEDVKYNEDDLNRALHHRHHQQKGTHLVEAPLLGFLLLQTENKNKFYILR